MSSLTRSEIGWIMEELEPHLVGALVQEVRQPDPRTVVLTVRTSGGTLHVLIRPGPDDARLHAVDRPPANPARPLPFQALARARLRGRIRTVELLEGDRIVVLTLGNRDESVTGLVVAELTSRPGDLFMLDRDGRVLGGLGRAPREGIRLGEAWSPPPRPAPHPTWLRPVRFEPLSGRPLPRSAAVEAYFVERARVAAEEALRQRLDRAMRAARARLERKAERQGVESSRGAEADEWRRRGELLAPAAGSIRRGTTSHRVTDWSGGEGVPVAVPLAPELDGRGNVDRCFRLARRLREGSVRAAIELERTRGELARLVEFAHRREVAADREALEAIWAELPASWRRAERERAAGPAQRRKAAPRLPYQVWNDPRGRPIWVGRSAEDNDALTFRAARGNDFWLHARGRAGAHVVVPARSGEPPPDTIRLAGQLALKMARLPEGERAEVAVTRVKYVRKVPGTPGKVTCTQDRTLWLTWTAADLAGLVREEDAGE